MKRILAFGFVFVFCFSALSFAGNKTVIYGFEYAKNFNGSSGTPVYIQAGSFLHHSKAVALRARLQSKTTYVVTLVQKKQWTVVIVGPIPSASDVRTTAQACDYLLLARNTNKLVSPPKYAASKRVAVQSETRLLHSKNSIRQQRKLRLVSKKRTVTVSPIGFQTKGYQPLVTLTVGPDVVRKGQAQTVTLVTPFQNYYTANSIRDTVVDGGAFLGVERALTERFTAQLGVAGYGDSKFTPRGDVWQFTEPEFDNLTYAYHVQHSRVMLAGKLLSALSSHKSVHPYFSWEVGAAFNRAYGYQEVSFTPGVLPMEPFADHNQSSLAYGVGFGLDYNVTQHIRLGAGYQFADLGSVSLGATPAASTIETLSLSHLYTNQLRFQFTYIM